MNKNVTRVVKAGTGLSKTGNTISILPSTSVSFNSQKITNLATPTASTDAATKGYVDAQTAGASTRAFGIFIS